MFFFGGEISYVSLSYHTWKPTWYFVLEQNSITFPGLRNLTGYPCDYSDNDKSRRYQTTWKRLYAEIGAVVSLTKSENARIEVDNLEYEI